MNVRFFTLLLAFTFSLGVVPAITETSDGDFKPTAIEAAQFLYDLGLFKGGENGFALDEPLTRAQAAVLMVRLMGKEDEALKLNLEHPFTDVEEWVSPYLGWLYQNQMVNGTSETTYSPDDGITYEHYGYYLNRLWGSGNSDHVPIALEPDRVLNDWDPKNNDFKAMRDYMTNTRLTRGDACQMSAMTLELVSGRHDMTFAQLLIYDGVFTEQQCLAAAEELYKSDYINQLLYYESSFYYTAPGFYSRAGVLSAPADEEGEVPVFVPRERGIEYVVKYNVEEIPDTDLVFIGMCGGGFEREIYSYALYDLSSMSLTVLDCDDNVPQLFYSYHLLSTGDGIFVSGEKEMWLINAEYRLERIYTGDLTIRSMCAAPDGIVMLLSDVRYDGPPEKYTQYDYSITELRLDGGTSPVFEEYWGEYLVDRDMCHERLLSYDGERLVLEFLRGLSFSSGMVYVTIYVCEITDAGLTCNDCYLTMDGTDLTEEERLQYIEEFPEFWVSKGMGLELLAG